MTKIGINWEAEMLPNKNLKVPETQYAIATYAGLSGYPIRDIRIDTIVRVIS